MKIIKIYALFVCRTFCLKLRSCKFFDKYQVCLILHQEWTARFEKYIIYDMFIICDGDDSSISNLSVTCAFKKSKSVSWTECLVRKYFFLFHFFSFGHFWNFYDTNSVEAWEAPVVRGKPTICHMLCTCTRTQSTLKV